MTDRCEGCGFVYDLASVVAGLETMRTLADRLAGLLARDEVDVRSRRSPEVWSPLEYGCHVRDVLLVQRERVLAAQRESEPVNAPMGRDERAVHDGYADQEPAAVARQLRDAALLLTGALARLDEAGWERTLIYNYPERRVRSLRWVAAHTHHELVHHLDDVLDQLAG